MNRKNSIGSDPLHELFEHYLFNRSYEDSQAFTHEIAEEYLAYLDSTPAHVPFHTRESILKELQSETHEMLIKKMYGCAKAPKHPDWGKVVEVRAEGELKIFDFVPSSSSKKTAQK